MLKKVIGLLFFVIVGKVQGDPFLNELAKGNFKKQMPLVHSYQQQDEHQRALMTAGRVTRKAYVKYQGNFDKYFNATFKTRRGKVFEEVVATYLNSIEASRNGKMRFVPTAAITSPQNPVDLLGLGKRGKLFEKYQLKMSGNEAFKALDEAKYLGQTIIIPADQIEFLKNELLKKQANAARRGKPLPAKWRTLEESLESGRLWGISTTSEITSKTEAFIKEEFKRLAVVEANERAIAQAVLSTEKAEAQALAKSVGTLSKLQVLGRCIVLADYALNVATFASELNSFMKDDLDGTVFAGKTGLKAMQFYLGYVAIANPEPVSKTAAIGLVLALAAADYGLDAINTAIIEPRKAYAARILSEVEPSQRGLIARNQLLEMYKNP